MDEALSGTGRHLTAVELSVWTALIDTSRILDSELERRLLEEDGMSHREYEVLVRIDGAGGRMRMSELARQIEASPALISQTVARLERRDWTAREQAADDRRGVDAVLLLAGRAALAAASAPHARLVRELLIAHIPDDLLGAVAEGLSSAADHLRHHRRGHDCDSSDCPMNRRGNQ